MYQPPNRDREDARWGLLRELTERAYIEMDDELSAAYYDYWRNGLSFQWGRWDTRNNPPDDLRQFNLLCIMLQDMNTIVFHRMNVNDPLGGVPEDQYRFRDDTTYDEDGNQTGPLTIVDLPAVARTRLNETTGTLGVSTRALRDHFLQRVYDLSGHNLSGEF